MVSTSYSINLRVGCNSKWETPKIMKLYLSIFLFLTFKVYGQAPVDIKYYIYNKQISITAIDFYNGMFYPNDDAKTWSIFDSLETKNDSTRPFYIFLVSKIIDSADGALAETLGENCQELIESNSDFLIDFLYSKNKIVEKHFIDNWAKSIASQFMMLCEGKEKYCINKSFKKASLKCRLDNKSKLKEFYKKVESYCR